MAMARSLVALLACAVTLVAARNCTDITVPITISSQNQVFNVTTPTTNVDATNFILEWTQQGHNYADTVLTGTANVSGKYNLSTTYCEPDSGPTKAVQLLTHGIAFDRSYWDLSVNDFNYSYVKQAVDEYNYSTLSWDRLGIGMSSHGEPVNEIQVWLEVAAMHALTVMLRNGSIPGVSTAFQKVVHVGHSYGSIQSYTLAAMFPSDSDGLILSGFSQNVSFAGFFGLGGNFELANRLPSLAPYPAGYLASETVNSVQVNFFAPGMFDPLILDLAYATGEPVTVGELLTFPGSTGSPTSFAGPVLIITGQRDIPFCGGDCFATGDPSLASIPAASAKMFPNASIFDTFIVPETGHGLNLQYSWPLTYKTMLDFVSQNITSP